MPARSWPVTRPPKPRGSSRPATAADIGRRGVLARARRLVGLKGYVTNIDAAIMPAAEVIHVLPRPVARRAIVPDVQDRPTRSADVSPHP